MNEQDSGRRGATNSGAPAVSSDAASNAPSPDEAPKDHFLQLMFFQAGHPAGAPHQSPNPELATGSYAPLRHSTARPGERYELPIPNATASVRLDSPATEVMTDLRRVSAVTIDLHASIDEANRVMIARGVRALFVTDDARQVSGIITSADILGERPVTFAQGRGIRYGEVGVRDIMTPADQMEILDIDDVIRARVGDVIATLRRAGRQHALAVEAVDDARAGRKTLRGIFSLTQIARQLGIPPQEVHDMARTFAEIEAAISA